MLYVRNEFRIRGLEDIEFPKDFPPDLVIHMEAANGDLNNLEAYAEAGVGELWQCDGKNLAVMLLTESGTYVKDDASRNLPDLPLIHVQRFLNSGHGMGETEWILSFRKWVIEYFRI